MQIDPIEAAINAGEFDLKSMDEFNEFLEQQDQLKQTQETTDFIHKDDNEC